MKMNIRTRNISFALAAPLLSVAMLVGIVAENRTYLKAEQFEPYHQTVKAAIEAIPYGIGTWIGKDEPVPEAAMALLKQPVIVSRRYVDTAADMIDQPDRTASLLFVQCKQSADMVGHYPPNCYRTHGNEMVAAIERDWMVDDMKITGMEYRFERRVDGQKLYKTVYNFLLVPGKGIKRDMEGVKASAEDYQQRYYGAAQVQVVFNTIDAPPPGKEAEEVQKRDEIFKILISRTLPAVKAVLDTTPVSRTLGREQASRSSKNSGGLS
jgi:hypothetical protein